MTKPPSLLKIERQSDAYATFVERFQLPITDEEKAAYEKWNEVAQEHTNRFTLRCPRERKDYAICICATFDGFADSVAVVAQAKAAYYALYFPRMKAIKELVRLFREDLCKKQRVLLTREKIKTGVIYP